MDRYNGFEKNLYASKWHRGSFLTSFRKCLGKEGQIV